MLCCGYTLTDFPISIRLTSLALRQSNDCPSASKATLMNMDKYLMWIDYERLHNHNKAKHNKTVCIFLGIYCNIWRSRQMIKYFADIFNCIFLNEHMHILSHFKFVHIGSIDDMPSLVLVMAWHRRRCQWFLIISRKWRITEIHIRSWICVLVYVNNAFYLVKWFALLTELQHRMKPGQNSGNF